MERRDPLTMDTASDAKDEKRAPSTFTGTRRSLLFLPVICSTLLFIGVVWHLCFPLINITSGEPKPRSTFISENAILQHASPAFSGLDAQRSLALQTVFSSAFHETTNETNHLSSRAFAFVVSWFKTKCEASGLQTEVQWIRRGSLANIVCAAKARGSATGYEYLLTSASIDANSIGYNAVLTGGGVGSTMPHEAFVALSLAQQLVGAPWLAKDAVFLFSVYSDYGAHISSEAGKKVTAMRSGKGRARVLESLMEREAASKRRWASLGLDAFLRAHDYYHHSQQHDNQHGGLDDIRPLQHHYGVLRSALSLDFVSVPPFHVAEAATTGQEGKARVATFIPEPSHLAISVAGPSGKTPELDFTTLTVSAFKLRFPVLLADAADGRAVMQRDRKDTSGMAQVGGSQSMLDEASYLSTPSIVVDVQAQLSSWGRRQMAKLSASSPASSPLIHGFLRTFAVPVTRLVQGRPYASVSIGDLSEYASRLLTYALTTLRMLVGPFQPHAAVLARGGGAYHAASLVFGRRQDFYSKLPSEYHSAALAASRANPGQHAASSNGGKDSVSLESVGGDCHTMNPCDYRQRILPLQSIGSFASEVDAFEGKLAATINVTAATAEAAALASAEGGSSAVIHVVVGIGQGLERVLRAMSGTEERLHASLQSNGYVMLSPTLFVGMHEFLAASALLHLPILMIAIASVPPWASVGGRSGRDFVVIELLCCALLLALSACKGLVLAAYPWVLDHSVAWLLKETLARAPAAATVAGKDGFSIALLLAIDAIAAFLLIPVVRRVLLSTVWCSRVIPASEDGERLRRLKGKPIESTGVTPQPAPAVVVAVAPPSLSSALFVACVCFLVQQLQLMYLHYALFIASCLFVAPVLIAAFTAVRLAAYFCGPRTKGGSDAESKQVANLSTAQTLASSATVLVIASLAYLFVAPQGWAWLSSGAQGALYADRAASAWAVVQGLAGVFTGSGYQQFQLPVMLHLQAIFLLVVSSCL